MMNHLHNKKDQNTRQIPAAESPHYKQEGGISATPPSFCVTAAPVSFKKEGEEKDDTLQKKENNQNFAGNDIPTPPSTSPNSNNILNTLQRKQETDHSPVKQYKAYQLPVRQNKVQQFKQFEPFQLKDSGVNQKSQGQMPQEVQAKMENSMGHDFSNVNIHKNSKSATDAGALAYAQGNDVHFAPGQFKPDTKGGQELIGHELAHVVQQREGRVKPTKMLGKGMPVNDDPRLEREADEMGAKAAQGKPSQMKMKTRQGSGNGIIQKTDDDSTVLNDLNKRAAGDTEYDYAYDAVEDKSKAIESADSHFKNAYGEENFAENLIQTINTDLIKAYDQIKMGQVAAIDAIQSSINAKKEKEQMQLACLIAFVSIVGAWAPLAAAAVSTAEKNMMAQMQKQIGDSARITSIRIPYLAQKVKGFGESKMLSPWMTTMRAVKGLIKSKPKSAKESIQSNVSLLADKTSFAVHGLLLEMGMDVKDMASQNLDAAAISGLKSSLYKEIMGAIFPEYISQISEQSFASIQGLAKTQMLKNIILNSGKISNSQFSSSYDSIEGNRHKEGSSTVEHALNAIGGEEALAQELKNPNEFAFASLNSTLTGMGLAINTTDENKKKARETDYLDQNRGFAISIKDEAEFLSFLNDKPIVTNNRYGAQSGAIKDLKGKFPLESSFMYSSVTSYEFNYDDASVSDMEVWIHPSEYTSMLEGKIKDIKTFTLKFSTAGNANVIKRYTKRTGVSRSNHGTSAVNGLNHIKVFA